jgi:protein-disulfide isomerase
MEKDISTSTTILIVMTIILLGGLTAFILLNNKNEADATTAYTENPSIEGQPVMGDENAPISIVEFGDYKCPTCKRWEEIILPKLEADFIDSKKVKFSFINVLFHGKESTISSLADEYVYSQNPQQYWNFHKVLFDSQEKKLTIAEVAAISSKIDGIKKEELEQAILNQKKIAEIEKDKELTIKFKVQQTPTIFINNIQISDPFDYEQIKNIIGKELNKSYEK